MSGTAVRMERFAFGANGTFSRLRVFRDDEIRFTCFALEPPPFPWVMENAEDISMIPPGVYKVERGIFHRNTPDKRDDYECLVIPDGEVPYRGPGLKIHGGNTIEDTKGCPLVGRSIDFMGDLPAVVSSRTTLIGVLDAFGPGPGILTIRELR